MLMISKDTVVIRIDDDVAETDFENKIVLLHIENGEYYNFNETGSDLWHWLSDEHTIQQLAEMIANKYDCTTKGCLPDVIAWVNDVVDKKLIKIIE
jgi:hypothetical protein